MNNIEIRNLIVQNNEIVDNPIIDNNMVMCGTYFSISCAAGWFAFNSLVYLKVVAKYVWKLLWNSLTPGNQWIELIIISVTIVSSILLFKLIEGMVDILDDGFVKLKNEIKKKDERIEELELKQLNKFESYLLNEHEKLQDTTNVKLLRDTINELDNEILIATNAINDFLEKNAVL